MEKPSRRRRLAALALLLLTFGAVTGNWAASAGEAFVVGPSLLGGVWFALWFAATFSAALGIYAMRRQFSVPRSLAVRSPPDPHRVVIFTVSTPTRGTVFPAALRGHAIVLRSGAIESAFTLLGDDLAADIGRVAGRWNWQQILRGIQPHLPRVERVHLLGSPGDDGSFAWLPRCKEMLALYLRSDVEVRIHPRAVDFESVDDVIQAIRSLVDDETDRSRVSERDVIVDITGGQKTTSAAAAVVTLNSRVTFQYVSAEAPTPRVRAYDLVYETPPGIG